MIFNFVFERNKIFLNDQFTLTFVFIFLNEMIVLNVSFENNNNLSQRNYSIQIFIFKYLKYIR